MNVAWLGLGKLGGPCALALARPRWEQPGRLNPHHRVRGYDPNPTVRAAFAAGRWPHDEPGVEGLMASEHAFSVADSLADALVGADVVVVAVQTPHGPGYGGEVPMPDHPAPFDTSVLLSAVTDAARALDRAENPAPIVVVSTVLPGTCRDVLEPTLAGRTLIYSPAFVAMGSVLADLKAPEFVLAGVRDKAHAEVIRDLYAHVDAPLIVTGVESAELAKVAYNTAIGVKIVLANALGELAEAVGADVDEVTGVLAAATERVTSSRYLSAGMGDGGPCHPRDAIAMAWLARNSDLSADPFGFIVRAREAQAEALADLLLKLERRSGLPIAICGRSYKAGVSIEDGSAALLVGHYVEAAGHAVRWLQGNEVLVAEPMVFLVAVPDRQPNRYPPGSVVVDPWGVVAPDAATVIRIGRL